VHFSVQAEIIINQGYKQTNKQTNKHISIIIIITMKLTSSIALTAIVALAHSAAAGEVEQQNNKNIRQRVLPGGRTRAPVETETPDRAVPTSCALDTHYFVELKIITDNWGSETAIYLTEPKSSKLIFSAPVLSLESNMAYAIQDFCLEKEDEDGVGLCYDIDVFDTYADGIFDSDSGIFLYVDGKMEMAVDADTTGAGGAAFKHGGLWFGENCGTATTRA
jgi:hypothetical protein